MTTEYEQLLDRVGGFVADPSLRNGVHADAPVESTDGFADSLSYLSFSVGDAIFCERNRKMPRALLPVFRGLEPALVLDLASALSIGPRAGNVESEEVMSAPWAFDGLGRRSRPGPALAPVQPILILIIVPQFAILTARVLACGALVVATDCADGPDEIVDNEAFAAFMPIDTILALAASASTHIFKTPYSDCGLGKAPCFASDAVLTAYLRMAEHG